MATMTQTYKTSHATLEVQLKSSKERLRKSEGQVKEYQRKITELKHEIQVHETSIKVHVQTNSNLSLLNRGLKEEKDGLRGKTERAKLQADAARGNALAIKEKLDDTEGRLQKSYAERDVTLQKWKRADEREQKAEDRIQALSSMLESLQESHQTDRSRMQELEDLKIKHEKEILDLVAHKTGPFGCDFSLPASPCEQPLPTEQSLGELSHPQLPDEASFGLLSVTPSPCFSNKKARINKVMEYKGELDSWRLKCRESEREVQKLKKKLSCYVDCAASDAGANKMFQTRMRLENMEVHQKDLQTRIQDICAEVRRQAEAAGVRLLDTTDFGDAHVKETLKQLISRQDDARKTTAKEQRRAERAENELDRMRSTVALYEAQMTRSKPRKGTRGHSLVELAKERSPPQRPNTSAYKDASLANAAQMQFDGMSRSASLRAKPFAMEE